MAYKYKTIKAGSPELLASLMNRNDLKTGHNHTYEIGSHNGQMYAIYKAVPNYGEELNDNRDEPTGQRTKEVR